MRTDRRKNFRYPPGGEAKTVVLRCDGTDQSATVANLSAEGFRITFEIPEGTEPPKVGDVALLATQNGSHQVRIANVQVEKGIAHIGLERLADFSRPNPRQRREDPSKGHVGGGRRFGDQSSSLFLKVAIVAGVAVLGIVGINLTLTARGNSSDHPAAENGNRPATAAQPEPPRSRVDRQAPTDTKNFQASAERNQAADAKFDASIKIGAALKRAAREKKTVLVEFGTEKCDACYRLHDFMTKNADFAAAFEKDFVLVLVDKSANRALFNRLVPAEHHNEASFFTLLDKAGQPLKGEKTDQVASGSGFDIDKIKALLEPSAAPKK